MFSLPRFLLSTVTIAVSDVFCFQMLAKFDFIAESSMIAAVLAWVALVGVSAQMPGPRCRNITTPPPFTLPELGVHPYQNAEW